MLEKMSSHITPIDFERQDSLAYYLGKGWERGVNVGVRQSFDFSYRSVDPQLIKEASCMLFRVSLEHKDVGVFLIYPPLPYKKTNREFRLHTNDVCSRIFESLSTKRAELRKQRTIIARLAEAVDKGNEEEFVEILNEIRWEGRPSEDFINTIKLALKVGAHLVAREIASEGVKHHPANQEIQKHGRILAPPKIISSDLPPDPSQKLNRDWLKAHRGDFRNKWLAIRNGNLLGVADSLKELTEKVNDEDVLFTKA